MTRYEQPATKQMMAVSTLDVRCSGATDPLVARLKIVMPKKLKTVTIRMYSVMT